MVVSFEGHLEAWDKRLFHFLVWLSPVRMFLFRPSCTGEAVNSSCRILRQRLNMWLSFRFLSIYFMFVHLESDP